MAKKLVIPDCSKCPFVDHGGGFGAVSYIPKCGKKGNKTLPYTEHVYGGRITAHGIKVIPEWCPLENNN